MFASLKRKKLMLPTPLNEDLKALIIEGFCRSICTSIVEIIEDVSIMRSDRLSNYFERLKTNLFYIIIPLGKFGESNAFIGTPKIDISD
jgi:hypothetical protein